MELKERNKQIIDLYLSGKKLAEVANIFGITHQRVSKILKKNNVKTRSRITKALIVLQCTDCLVEGNYTYISKKNNRMLCLPCRERISDLWCSRLELTECKDCGRSDRQHNARGRCVSCHPKYLYHTNEERRKNHYKLTRNWQKNNPERNREITRKAVNKYKSKPENKLALSFYYSFMSYGKKMGYIE